MGNDLARGPSIVSQTTGSSDEGKYSASMALVGKMF